jgi:UDP-N-acetylglucosamine acyltransferase
VANRIHPTAVIGDGVELGDDNVIGPYTVITGPCRIGNGNWISPHVSIGGPAEYRGGPHPVGWDGELEGPGVRIGDGNTIREYVAVNQGIAATTTIGDRCYLLARSQVAHDCVLENDVTMASAVQLGGHCHVWALANLGLGAVVHQRSVIGPGAMVGMGAAVRKEVGPFAVAVGVPAKPVRLNTVGLQRRGCSDEVIEQLKPFLAGHGDLPAGLPEEVAVLLKRWQSRSERN